MPQPSFLSKGDTPQRTDTKWTEAVRWLGQLQNQAGADPANDPRRTDSYRNVLYKIARAGESTVIPPTPPDPPAAPSGLTATQSGLTSIDLAWTDNSSDETGFKIERKTGIGGTYAEIHTTAADVTMYADTGLTANTTYYYRVRATNADGDSDYSNEADANTDYTPEFDTQVVEWLKADVAGITFFGAGRIDTWPASIGTNAVHGRSEAGDTKCFLDTNAQNGLPVIRMEAANASGGFMKCLTFGTISQPFEVWVMFKWQNRSNYRYCFDRVGDGFTTLGYSITGDGAFTPPLSNKSYLNAASGLSGTGPNVTADDNYHIMRCVFNGASSSITVDGGAPVTGDVAGSRAMVGLMLGDRYDNISTNGGVLIGEIFVANAIGSNTVDRLAYLNSRWATF